MSRLYYTFTTRPILILISGIAVVLLVIPQWAIMGLAIAGSMVSVQLAFTPENFRAVVEPWGAAGIEQYRAALFPDYLMAVAYAVFLASIFARLTDRYGQEPGRGTLLLFAAPFAAALFDMTENTLHLVLLSDLSSFPAGLVLLASVAAAIKWALLLVALIAVLLALIKRVRARD